MGINNRTKFRDGLEWTFINREQIHIWNKLYCKERLIKTVEIFNQITLHELNGPHPNSNTHMHTHNTHTHTLKYMNMHHPLFSH